MRSLPSITGTVVAVVALTGALVGTVTARAARLPAQAPADLRANWQDLETWSHYLDSSHENELGLGLQLSGTGGTVLVAFLGRLDVRAPLEAPRSLTVQVGTSELANPNFIRRPVLTFVLDDRTDARVVLDLTPRLSVDNPAPGAQFENGLAGLRSTDFVRLTEARTIDANAFGFQVSFRPDQIAALAALGERLHLTRAVNRRLH